MKKKICRTIARPVLSALGLTLLVATAAAAQDTDNLKLAERLVEQAQLHKMAALGMRLSVQHAVVAGKASQALLECVSATDPAIFSRHIAAVYAAGLSAAELNEALAFFDSAAGRKYVAFAMQGTEKYAGFPPSSPPITVTPDEKKAIEAFAASSVGKQLSGGNSPIAMATQRDVASLVQPIIAGCPH